MNTEIILKMVKPYLKDNKISFSDFRNLFSVLSRKEQCDVIDILMDKNINCVPDDSKEDNCFLNDTNNQISKNVSQQLEDKFEILYDEKIFKDYSSYYGEKTFYYKDIKQSNEILSKLIQEGNQQAKQDICVKNKSLVDKYVSMYQKLYGNHLDFDDLEQAGMIGLIKAAEKFDMKKEVKFSTYAVFWIRQSILREILNNGFAIRVPVHMMEQINRITKLDNKLAAKQMGYQERIEEISNSTGMSIESIKYCLMIKHNYLSYFLLNTPIGEEEDIELQDMIEDKEAISVEDMVCEKILHEILLDVLDYLTPREEKVLRLRYGLDDNRTRTLEEIGEEFHVTRERIRQIEKKALGKLKCSHKLNELREFL